MSMSTLYDTMSLMADESEEGDTGPPDRFAVLVRSALALSTEHDPDRILDQVVECAAEVAGARYAALGVYGVDGRIERFAHHGVDVETVARIGHHPEGRGLLGEGSWPSGRSGWRI